MMERIQGLRVALRLVQPEDAGYIHALRMNPAYNRHLSPVSGSVADQLAWIKRYKRREAAGQEFYYVIERRDGIPCGLVRLYDILADRFTWGSWILAAGKPAKAALESAVLSFGVGFNTLGCEMALLDVRRANTHATDFYRRFGASEIGQDAENIYFELARDRFNQGHRHYLDAIASKESTPR